MKKPADLPNATIESWAKALDYAGIQMIQRNEGGMGKRSVG